MRRTNGLHGMNKKDQVFDAWNPGLNSEIPGRLLPYVTLYRPENSEVGYTQAKEAADFCGLDTTDMISFRVERLIVHELLIRVTADLSVPDGPNYEELGINMRSMTARILDTYIEPKLEEIHTRFAAIKNEADSKIREILDADVFNRVAMPPVDQKSKGLFKRLFRKDKPEVVSGESSVLAALTDWQKELNCDGDPFRKACLRSLMNVVGGIVGQRGRLMADQDIITKFALIIFCNTFGSQAIGKLIEPIFADAVKAESYRFLPAQTKTFFMNVKGASAAGKSTIRPLQRLLAEKLKVPWEDFALISPDYWRKFLLDYGSLGADYKYAAMLTGQELEIIDKKLDKYMEHKASIKAIPHLLIDRFRFDSFETAQDQGQSSQLLTRFGDTVFLFFIITPPAATVERAWKRGNITGRYKAVDDLLFHNIEAYTGMPNLFFSWVSSTSKKIHFEFLDNSVAFGKRPRTVAFGWNNKMTILDLKILNDIDRFRNVNIDATTPEDVLINSTSEPFDFLKNCLKKIPDVTLADHESTRIYGQFKMGEWVYKDTSILKEYNVSSFNTKCLSALGWEQTPNRTVAKPLYLDTETDTQSTLGDWGGSER